MADINTPAGRRNLIRNFVSETRWLKQSGSSLLRSLRSSGLGINTGDFFTIRRAKLIELSLRDDAKLTPTQDLIPLADHTTRVGQRMTRNFKYTVAFTGTDSVSGNPKTIFRSVLSNTQLSYDETLDLSLDALQDFLYKDQENFSPQFNSLSEAIVSSNFDPRTQ